VNVPVLKRVNAIKVTFGQDSLVLVSLIKYYVQQICAQMAKPVTGTVAALISENRYQFVITILLLALIKQIATQSHANVISHVRLKFARTENLLTLLIAAALMFVRVRIV
jgi:hypothetical protein